jgi:uncharacterized protein with HEPN domain
MRDPRLALLDIQRALAEIDEFIKGKSIDDYLVDRMLQASVERSIEIVSEASRRIPVSLRRKHLETPWTKIAAIGNVLRHQYHEVDSLVIWNVVVRELPPLAGVIRSMLNDLE